MSLQLSGKQVNMGTVNRGVVREQLSSHTLASITERAGWAVAFAAAQSTAIFTPFDGTLWKENVRREM